DGAWSCNLHLPCRFFPVKCNSLASLEQLLCVDPPEELNQFCNGTGPASLMTRSQPSAVVAVEIFVKQNVIFPIRIGLEFLGTPIDRPSPRVISQKDPG